MKNQKLDLNTSIYLLHNVRDIDNNGDVIAEDPNEGSWDLLVNITSSKYGISRKKVNLIFMIADKLERYGIIKYEEPVQKRLHK